MRKVLVDATGFFGDYIHINGQHIINAKILDIIRATICVGHSNWKQILFKGSRRYLESIYHVIGSVGFTKASHGNLALADNFFELDMSEKNPITYRLGMTTTKLVAEKILEVPWLIHVDKLVKEGIANITTGTLERGDLAGLSLNNDWHVLESKGRSNPPGQAALRNGKNQAGRITTINGVSPKTKSVCLSYFNNNKTTTYLQDPPDGEDFPDTSWEIDKHSFIMHYYGNILNFIEERIDSNYQPINSWMSFELYNLGETDLVIGVYSPIIKQLRNNSTNFIGYLYEAKYLIKEFEKSSDFNNISIGLDGILIMNR